MRIPAKANTIMTPRIISQKKRNMSILVGHSWAQRTADEKCCSRCVGIDGSGQGRTWWTAPRKTTIWLWTPKGRIVDLDLERRYGRI